MAGKRGVDNTVLIQKRDIDILKALYACEFLSTSQIQRLFFGISKTAVCRRLNEKLLPQKIVTRYYPNVRFQNIEAIYYLGTEGVKLLAEELGISASEIKKPSDRAYTVHFLQHVLETNDFWVSIREACNQSQGEYGLVSWWTERKIRKRFQRVGEPTPLPDSRFTLLRTADGVKSHFMLEIDRGTEKLGVIREKVQNYKDYYMSDRQEEDFGFKKFRVLTVVPDEKRLKEVLRAAAEARANNMFLFGLKKDMIPDRIFESVWVLSKDFYETYTDSKGDRKVEEIRDHETVSRRYSIV